VSKKRSVVSRTGSSVRPDLIQPVVADSEVVRDLMSQDALDQLTHLFNRAATNLDRPPVDTDPVRRDKSVIPGARRLGHAVVEAQQLVRYIFASHCPWMPGMAALADEDGKPPGISKDN